MPSQGLLQLEQVACRAAVQQECCLQQYNPKPYYIGLYSTILDYWTRLYCITLHCALSNYPTIYLICIHTHTLHDMQYCALLCYVILNYGALYVAVVAALSYALQYLIFHIALKRSILSSNS